MERAVINENVSYLISAENKHSLVAAIFKALGLKEEVLFKIKTAKLLQEFFSRIWRTLHKQI